MKLLNASTATPALRVRLYPSKRGGIFLFHVKEHSRLFKSQFSVMFVIEKKINYYGGLLCFVRHL